VQQTEQAYAGFRSAATFPVARLSSVSTTNAALLAALARRVIAHVGCPRRRWASVARPSSQLLSVRRHVSFCPLRPQSSLRDRDAVGKRSRT